MKEYNIQVKVRNNYLLSRMRSNGFETAAELSRATDVSQSEIGHFLNLTESPYNKKNGELRPAAIKICEVLKCSVSDIFPEAHLHEPLETNKSEVEVSFQEISALLASSNLQIEDELSNQMFIRQLLTISNLSPKEIMVIESRFIDGDTFDEIGGRLHVSRERIRQIEATALRKMRNKVSCNDSTDENRPLSINDINFRP